MCRNTWCSLNKEFIHTGSLVGTVSKTNKPYNFSNMQEKKRKIFNNKIDKINEISSVRSILIYPISISHNTDEEIFGAVTIIRKNNYEFNTEQRQIARITIQQAAKGIKYSNKLRDISEQAIIDSLSGLYNQRYFKEMLSKTVSRAVRYPEKISLILLDLDNFKKINDDYGHLAGDKIISAVGKTILETIREIDISARYGGDEFAILLPNTDSKGSITLAEKIKSNFENKLMKMNELKIKPTFSLGIATFPDNAETKNDLFEKSDEALYEAKNLGKNIIIHSNEMNNNKSSNY